ncbi:MAG: homogentisate 1,2-dioxygenase [Candidatus Marinimicrobia bacterium]|nr:homogentisate 1,2-dioxygenase [Candidatus Neomarinimicrobiota bacterium]
MPFYQHQGKLPRKRHIQFRDEKGNLFWEELISRDGFSSIYSNVYHLNPPTALVKLGEFQPINLEKWEVEHRHHHLKTHSLNSIDDGIKSRIPLFYNNDVILSKAHVTKSMINYYRNGHFDEVIFIHSGKGKLQSNFGSLSIGEGDYIVIPRGVIWKIEVLEKMYQFIIESSDPIETPNRYRNRNGQLLEHSPYSERDIRTPIFTDPAEDKNIIVNVKFKTGIQSYKYEYNPCDLIGWDGFYYPWVFNINDFMPITGKVHQPPPVHQTFQTQGMVICSFVPRLFDYHPESVPAPYAHSNVDSDEILYYVKGNFMSRTGMEEGSITFHPMGLPHGPQPGKIEESLGKKETTELAVMVDTFNPLNMTIHAKNIDETEYPYSWLK